MAAARITTKHPRLRSVDGEPPNPVGAPPVDRALSEPPPVSAREYREGGVVAEKYRLIRKVGEGGMGTVWVAHNEALDIPVAIKFIRAGEDSIRHVGRLTQEARAAAKIGHPAILRVFDFGKTEAGDPFIVMELLHGEDLAAALDRRGSLTERRAVQILLPVLHALVSAHAKGIVHRDLKPDNIFLAETDAGRIQPKLVDFGVAKLNIRGFERLTQSGAVLGSPAYMSPEQARGREVDQATDVWAACVVLYEMVTGALPFEGDNYNALLWAILNDEPIPTSTHAGGDPRLWRIIQKGLAKDPRGRHGSMADLGRELASWLFEQGVFVDITGASLQSTWMQRSDSALDDFGGSSPKPHLVTADLLSTVSQSRPALGPSTRSTLSALRASGSAFRDRRRVAVFAGLAAAATGLLLFGLLRVAGPRRATGVAPDPSALGIGATRSPRGVPVAPVEPAIQPAAVRDGDPLAAASASASTVPTSGVAPARSTPRSPPTPAKPPRKLKNPFEL